MSWLADSHFSLVAICHDHSLASNKICSQFYLAGYAPNLRTFLELSILKSNPLNAYMITYNITFFTCSIDDPVHLKQMALVKTPLKTKFEGKPEQFRTHVKEFTHRMQNTGLYHEIQIKWRKHST